MRAAIFALLFAGSALAQTPPAPVVVKITVELGGESKTVSVIMREKTILTDFACNKESLEVGESMMCTVKLNQPVTAVTPFRLILPAGLVTPASSAFIAGASTVSFTVTRTALIGAIGPAIIYDRFAVDGAQFAEIMIPCCARADACGLPRGEVSATPCVG
jgi:hypothetical protein